MCLNCGNCKSEDSTYFCLMQNDFVVKQKNEDAVVEKVRSGWKKGDINYEKHRRKVRKDVETPIG